LEGIVNAVAPQTITNQELTLELAKHLNKKILLPNLPQWLMKIVLGEMSILLFNSKKILPSKALQNNFHFQFPTLQKALTEIIK
jgi:NAD dependent epimerase/dehydratase family enzyme